MESRRASRPLLSTSLGGRGRRTRGTGIKRCLAVQVEGAIANSLTMGNTHERAVRTVSAIAGYKDAFREVWRDDVVSIDRIAEAIVAYETTRLSGNSRYDRFIAGHSDALTDQARAGRDLFFGKAECGSCHSGWDFTDSRFYNLGIGWNPSRGSGPQGFADIGRAKVTNRDEETGAFKTPTLRNVSDRAPYMHDGSVPTLHDVVDHYNRGGTPNPWLSRRLHPLGLTAADVDALVAFLESLSGEGFEDKPPRSLPQ
jgi:cytochrome c peroxidase